MSVEDKLTDEEMQLIIEPDAPYVKKELFRFGKNSDGESRVWALRPLDFHYEKAFRRVAMPMLAASYRPFEVLMANLSAQFVTEHNPSVIKAMSEAEIEVDDYLVKAVHIILMAQDNKITLDWVEKNAPSRDYLFKIVQKQADIHKLMDRLGESLAERLGRLAQMMGIQIDLPSLQRLWKQLTADFSAKITSLSTTVPSVLGRFTESSSETSMKSSTTNDVSKRGQDAIQPLIDQAKEAETSSEEQENTITLTRKPM